MSSSPKVSVCLPVHNGQKYIAEAIECVLSQTYEDFEFIIADDCSDDNTISIVLSYAANDPRIVLLRNKQKLGSAGNHNKCFRESRGEYIKPAHYDDILNRTALERMVSELERRPHVSLVSCARDILGPGDELICTNRHYEQDCEMPGRQAIIDNLLLFANLIGEPPAVMFRKSKLGRGFLAELYWYKDIQCWIEILKQGDYFFIADVLCKHRQHDGTATNRNCRELFFIADVMNLLRWHAAYMEEAGYTRVQMEEAALKAIARSLDFAVNVLKIDYGSTVAPLALTENSREVSEMLLSSMHEMNRRKLKDEEQDRHIQQLQLAKQELEGLKVSLENQISSLQGQCDGVLRDKLALEKQLRTVLNSRSWKITAPLRRLKQKSMTEIFRKPQS